MIACVDVDYRDNHAIAACVLFRSWTDSIGAQEKVVHISPIEPYVPGQFYRRELPCLLAVLGTLRDSIEAIVVDGYVWLRDERTPGMGARLFEAMGGLVPIIGVAKTR